jgi:hypothetical protein
MPLRQRQEVQEVLRGVIRSFALGGRCAVLSGVESSVELLRVGSNSGSCPLLVLPRIARPEQASTSSSPH